MRYEYNTQKLDEFRSISRRLHEFMIAYVGMPGHKQFCKFEKYCDRQETTIRRYLSEEVAVPHLREKFKSGFSG